jgi:hypothetical protein
VHGSGRIIFGSAIRLELLRKVTGNMKASFQTETWISIPDRSAEALVS